jgi:hypothetical protein
VESDDFEAELDARSPQLSEQDRAIARGLHDDGYALVHDAVPTELCDRVRAEIEPLFEEEYAVRERRVPDAWRRGAESVREIATFQAMQDRLASLYGRRPIPFQTLNFKWGSQQGYHADAIHFTSVPDRYMCGVWVALEDVHHDNGPLTYYPGSHRVPQFRSFEPGAGPERYAMFEASQRAVMEQLGVEPVDLDAKKGDALIWTSSLLHGGRPIISEGSTRWSQVTHYFFEDCIYFQPIYSDFITGEIKLLDIVDINTLEPVAQRYGNLTAVTTRLPDGRSRLGIVDDEGNEVAGDVATQQRMEQDLAQVTADRDALRLSTSFQIGNTLVAPLHWIRGRLR